MAFINWSEDFITGIASIDEQHRHLVELVNKLEEASRRNREPRVLSEILSDLVGYTQEHFAHEEKIMAECGFPGARRHQASHRMLLQQVERFQYGFDFEERPITDDIWMFLRFWVRYHIQQDDMALAEHLQDTSLTV